MYKTIAVEPLTASIGAIISGIDLASPGDAQLDDVNQALLDHSVVFFRDQKNLDPASLEKLGSAFGELHEHALKNMPETPHVMKMLSDENSKHVNGEEWHTDSTCNEKPPMGSILYLHTIPPIGGDTVWASTYAAYDAVSENMKQYLEGLTALHDGMIAFGRFNPNVDYPKAVHPVITRHPVTGRKVINVNRGFTSHILELSERESRHVLEFLYQHIEDQRFQVRFRWEPHSVAFWDNRSSQHFAVWDYYPHVRSGYRVQIVDNFRETKRTEFRE